MKQISAWKGKPIDDMTKEELIYALEEMVQTYERECEHRRELQRQVIELGSPTKSLWSKVFSE